MSWIFSGQQTVSTTAAQLPAQPIGTRLQVTGLSSNTATIFVGGPGVTASGATGGYPVTNNNFPLELVVNNVNSLWIIGTNTTDVLAWIGD